MEPGTDLGAAYQPLPRSPERRLGNTPSAPGKGGHPWHGGRDCSAPGSSTSQLNGAPRPPQQRAPGPACSALPSATNPVPQGWSPARGCSPLSSPAAPPGPGSAGSAAVPSGTPRPRAARRALPGAPRRSGPGRTPSANADNPRGGGTTAEELPRRGPRQGPARPGPAASGPRRSPLLTSRPVQLEDVPQVLRGVLDVDAGAGGHGARRAARPRRRHRATRPGPAARASASGPALRAPGGNRRPNGAFPARRGGAGRSRERRGRAGQRCPGLPRRSPSAPRRRQAGPAALGQPRSHRLPPNAGRLHAQHSAGLGRAAGTNPWRAAREPPLGSHRCPVWL